MDACLLSPFSYVQLFVTLWTITHQRTVDPLSMGFSSQEYWSGLPFPSPEYLPNPGIEPTSPALQADSLPAEPLEKPRPTLGRESSARMRHSGSGSFGSLQATCSHWGLTHFWALLLLELLTLLVLLAGPFWNTLEHSSQSLPASSPTPEMSGWKCGLYSRSRTCSPLEGRLWTNPGQPTGRRPEMVLHAC